MDGWSSSEDEAVHTPGSASDHSRRIFKSGSVPADVVPNQWSMRAVTTSRDDSALPNRPSNLFPHQRDNLDSLEPARERIRKHAKETLERVRTSPGSSSLTISPGIGGKKKFKRGKDGREIRKGDVRFDDGPRVPRPPRFEEQEYSEREQIDMHALAMQNMANYQGANQYTALQTATDALWKIVRYLCDLVGGAMLILKTPLMVLIAFYAVFWCLGHSWKYSISIVHTSLQPICSIPGVSSLNLPFCKPLPATPPIPDYPQLINLQTKFEEVLENSVGGSSLALNMKQSESVIRDLATLVKVSTLSCRESLWDHLDTFSVSARGASRDLQKLGSRVGGAIDSILAMDEWALQRLQDINDSQPRNIFLTFNPWPSNDHSSVHDKLIGPFLKTSANLADQLEGLVIKAQAVLNTLDGLEEQLTTIYEIITREKAYVVSEKNEAGREVLVNLFTMLGGKKNKMETFNRHIQLLGEISYYRHEALAHVSATLIKLQQMSEDLEELRTKVAAPALLADVEDIPLEIHIKSIENGIKRLSQQKIKAQRREQEAFRKVFETYDHAAPDNALPVLVRPAIARKSISP